MLSPAVGYLQLSKRSSINGEDREVSYKVMKEVSPEADLFFIKITYAERLRR